jgi:isoaspartyl peptidase/L-asparaginase-like protein (Ntn-hydrolase superfamily)
VVSLGGDGGCVAVDAAGRVCMPFTTLGMPRACQLKSGERQVYVLGGPAMGAG